MPSLLVPGPTPTKSVAPRGAVGGGENSAGSSPHPALFAALLAQTPKPTNERQAETKDDPLAKADSSQPSAPAATLPPLPVPLQPGPPSPPIAEPTDGTQGTMDTPRPAGGELLSPQNQANGLSGLLLPGVSAPDPAHPGTLPPGFALPAAPLPGASPGLAQSALEKSLHASLQNLVGAADNFTGISETTATTHKDRSASTGEGNAGEFAFSATVLSAPTAQADAPSLAPTMPAADRAQIMQQVADKVGAMHLQAARGEQKQVILELHPREWGRLQVSITMAAPTAAGQVTSNAVVAHVLADNPTVKAALENHAAELRHALREAGLQLDSLTVAVQSALPSGQSGTATSDNRHQDGAGAWGQPPPNQNAGAQGGATGQGQGQSAFAAFYGDGGGHPGNRQGQTSFWGNAPVESTDSQTAELPRPGRIERRRVDTLA